MTGAQWYFIAAIVWLVGFSLVVAFGKGSQR